MVKKKNLLIVLRPSHTLGASETFLGLMIVVRGLIPGAIKRCVHLKLATYLAFGHPRTEAMVRVIHEIEGEACNSNFSIDVVSRTGTVSVFDRLFVNAGWT